MSLVYEPCKGDRQTPLAEVTRQPIALDHLVVIGQSPGQDLSWYRHSYLYNSKAGEDVTLYILDLGANLGHDVSNTFYTLKA